VLHVPILCLVHAKGAVAKVFSDNLGRVHGGKVKHHNTIPKASFHRQHRGPHELALIMPQGGIRRDMGKQKALQASLAHEEACKADQNPTIQNPFHRKPRHTCPLHCIGWNAERLHQLQRQLCILETIDSKLFPAKGACSIIYYLAVILPLPTTTTTKRKGQQEPLCHLGEISVK